MHICIWHGYHLRGTGSNVYVRNVAAEAVKAGHQVSLFCQEDDPLSLPFIERAYDLDDANAELIPLGGKVETGEPSCTVYRPSLAGHLPVYVYDKYDRFPRVTEMPDLDDSEIEDYIRQNVSALRTVFPDTSPDLVLTNHAVLSPEITRRAFGDTVRRISILHGSALSYSVKNDPRLHLLAVSGLKKAASVVVVSDGSGEKAREILGGDLPELDSRMKVVPCGVDTSLFKCTPVEEAIQSLQRALSSESGLAAGREIGPASANELTTKADAFRGTYNERLPDEKAFDKIMELDPARPGLLVYTGKLIVSKGVQALLLALPALFAKTSARLLVVGFGTYREGLTLLLHALASGDVEALRKIADLGTRLEGGEEAPLPEMASFLGSLDKTGRLDTYLETARTCGLLERVRFTGILEHDALCRVHALADLAVVPSIFPEAFGMVGIEAMACGALPVMARQGGLADLINLLREEFGDYIEEAISIDPSPERMVQSIMKTLPAALELVSRRPALKDDLSRIVAERFGWGSVVERLLATDTT